MENLNSKKKRYQNLLEKFKNYTFPKGYLNPYYLDSFKSKNVINPWELWHGSINKPKILFIGQDFSHKQCFEDIFNIKWKPDKTDQKLQCLFKLVILKDIGLPPNEEIELPLFFTNAVWAIKEGSKTSKIKGYWNGELIEFWRELIEIIEPCNIIAMGQQAYTLICKINKTKPITPLREAIKSNGHHMPSNLFVVYHVSGRAGIPYEIHFKDWKNIKSLLKNC